MSRAKRSKQESKTMRRMIILCVICLVVVIGTFIVIHDLRGKVEEVQAENTVNFVEIVNETAKNEVENETEENAVENTENTSVSENVSTTNTNKTEQKKSNNEAQSEYKPATTDNKQKAVDLVKEEWGEDDSVKFAFEYINENGEYVVSVRDKASATVKNYFRVNIDTKTVELD